MTTERKKELDAFAETLIAKVRGDIEEFVLGATTPTDEKKPDALVDELEQYQDSLKVLVETYWNGGYVEGANILDVIGEHVGMLKSIEAEIASVGEFAPVFVEKVQKLSHFQAMSDEELFETLRTRTGENLTRAILATEERMGALVKVIGELS